MASAPNEGVTHFISGNSAAPISAASGRPSGSSPLRTSRRFNSTPSSLMTSSTILAVNSLKTSGSFVPHDEKSAILDEIDAPVVVPLARTLRGFVLLDGRLEVTAAEPGNFGLLQLGHDRGERGRTMRPRSGPSRPGTGRRAGSRPHLCLRYARRGGPGSSCHRGAVVVLIGRRLRRGRSAVGIGDLLDLLEHGRRRRQPARTVGVLPISKRSSIPLASA